MSSYTAQSNTAMASSSGKSNTEDQRPARFLIIPSFQITSETDKYANVIKLPLFQYQTKLLPSANSNVDDLTKWEGLQESLKDVLESASALKEQLDAT